MTTLHEPETRRVRTDTGRPIIGVALVVAGIVWLADRTGLIDLEGALVLPIALMALGVVLVASWRGDTHGGLIGAGVLLTIVSLIVALAVPFGPIGDLRFSPRTSGDVAERYEMTAGTLTLDLAALDVSEATHVTARVGFGEIDVTVPDGVRVVAEGHAFVGDLGILGTSDQGFDLDRRVDRGDSDRLLVLDLTVVAGEINVTEVDRG